MRKLGRYNTSAEEASMERFKVIMAREGWTSRPPIEGETEQDTDLVFTNGGEEFVAWEEGPLIGAGRYPEELQSTFAFYEEWSPGYRRQQFGDEA